MPDKNLLTRIDEDNCMYRNPIWSIVEASTAERDNAYVNPYVCIVRIYYSKNSDVHQDLMARIRNPQLKHTSSQPQQQRRVDTVLFLC